MPRQSFPGSPFFVRFCCVSLLACCTRSRAISPGLTRGAARRGAVRSRERLQLQLHARWGYVGLGRVRCTSRPSVCSVRVLPLPFSRLCPPSFFLLLHVLSPHPRARRRLLPLSKSPAETRYMQAAASLAHRHTDTRGREYVHPRVCVPHETVCACRCLFASRVSSCPSWRKRRYDTIFGQCDSPHDVRFSKRR